MIRCEFDGQALFEVRDNRISSGKAGLRTNCLARYRDVRVEHPEDAYQVFLQTCDKEQRELDALRAKYPQPVLWRSLKLPEAEMVPRFGCLRNSENTDLLLLTPVPSNGIALWGKMVAMDLKGDILWEITARDPRLNSNYNTGVRLVDINGDGVDEIIYSTHHGNAGIVCLFDGNARFLNRFEPDHISYAGSTVNWSGDGEEFSFLTSSPQSFGLWDAWGRKVVDRWIPETEINQFSFFGKAGQHVRDLVGDPRDEIILMLPHTLRIYTQDQPFSEKRIFKPIRRSAVRPFVSYPNWIEF